MAKKETAAKKADTKKKSSTKKPTTKKQTKKVTKVTNEPSVIETVDLEKFKDEKGEYDLTNATELNMHTPEEVKSVLERLKSDDKIVVTKTEVVNGDPSVIAPVEEKVDEVEVVEEKKESTTKKIIRKFNQNFGYLWNGQMIDF